MIDAVRYKRDLVVRQSQCLSNRHAGGTRHANRRRGAPHNCSHRKSAVSGGSKVRSPVQCDYVTNTSEPAGNPRIHAHGKLMRVQDIDSIVTQPARQSKCKPHVQRYCVTEWHCGHIEPVAFESTAQPTFPSLKHDRPNNVAAAPKFLTQLQQYGFRTAWAVRFDQLRDGKPWCGV